MLELKFNPSGLRDYVKSMPKIKDQLFDLVRLDVKEVATDFVNGLMEAEFELFIGRDKHQRQTMLSVLSLRVLADSPLKSYEIADAIIKRGFWINIKGRRRRFDDLRRTCD